MNIDFEKSGGLVPAIVQDALTMQVLMLGYMNREALDKTIAEGKVTFFSRSKQRLWTKGEESGHFLFVDEILTDCDNDTILVKAFPQGPTCHTGSYSCFGNKLPKGFLYELENVIEQRIADKPENSYTSKLFSRGVNKVAQKVGEEAVETVIGAMANDDENFIYEGADLLYHLIVLLTHKGYRLEDLARELKKRHH